MALARRNNDGKVEGSLATRWNMTSAECLPIRSVPIRTLAIADNNRYVRGISCTQSPQRKLTEALLQSS